MNTSLARYHSRSPRYILQPHDNTLIRVAGPKQDPWEEGTEIKNLSLSGLAFTAPADLTPVVGEFIKIQFEVPQTGQMACFGLVTRLEPLSPGEMLVGVQFQKLELSHRIVLLQGLAQKLKEQQSRKELHERNQIHSRMFKHWPRTLAMIGALAIWSAFIFILSSTSWLGWMSVFVEKWLTG